MADQTIQELLQDLCRSFSTGKAAGLNGVIQFKLSGERNGDWFMEMQDRLCTVAEGVAPKANITISARASDLAEILSGKRDAVKAFMQGRLRLSGDMRFALKLQPLFINRESAR